MLTFYHDFITASKVESFAVYTVMYTVTFISLPIVLFGVLTAGLIIMMPF